MQNLRFGKLTLETDSDVNQHLNSNGDKGDGGVLSGHLTGIADKAKITAYEEQADENQINKFGSLAMFGV